MLHAIQARLQSIECIALIPNEAAALQREAEQPHCSGHQPFGVRHGFRGRTVANAIRPTRSSEFDPKSRCLATHRRSGRVGCRTDEDKKAIGTTLQGIGLLNRLGSLGIFRTVRPRVILQRRFVVRGQQISLRVLQTTPKDPFSGPDNHELNCVIISRHVPANRREL